MSKEIRFRMPEPPLGGNRIAWSYLAAVVASLLGGLIWAIWTPMGGLACPRVDDLCALGWTVSGALVSFTVALGVVAFLFRLGWEWWSVLAALLLGSPLWANSLPAWGLALVAVLAPGLSAVATWSGPRRPRWRPWLIGAVAVLLIGGAVLVLVWPVA